MTDSIKQIRSEIFTSGNFLLLKNALLENSRRTVLSGVSGSLASFIVNYIYNNSGKKIFYISHDNDRIIKLKDDLDILESGENISAYSSGLSDSESTSRILIDLSEGNEFIVIANASELGNKLISKDKFKASIIELKKNENNSFDDLIVTLEKYNFNRKDFVEEAGDYSVRGGIVDLFAENLESPVRIEFFGDTIESIREFDLNSQRSVREIDSVKIGINLNSDENTEETDNESEEIILDYIPEDALIIIDEPEITLNEIKEKEISDSLNKYKRIYLSSFTNVISEINDSSESSETNEISFDSKPQPEFHSNLKSLYQNLCENIQKGFTAYILASDELQAGRIKELIEDFEDENIIEQDEKIHTESDEINLTEKKNNKDFSIKNKFTVI